MARFRSEEEYQAAVEARAREIWEGRESRMTGMLAKYRQTWEQGSEPAKARTLQLARDSLAGKKISAWTI